MLNIVLYKLKISPNIGNIIKFVKLHSNTCFHRHIIKSLGCIYGDKTLFLPCTQRDRRHIALVVRNEAGELFAKLVRKPSWLPPLIIDTLPMT